MQLLSLFHFHCSISGAHSLVNSNDLNFNDVMCLVLHSKIKFFEGGGGVLSQTRVVWFLPHLKGCYGF